MLSAAKSLHSHLDTALSMLAAVKEALAQAEPEDISVNESIVSIFLLSNNELSVFLAKIQSLERIYSELCRLMDISTSEYPLKIIKVEAGSLWVKLFGESKIITLLTDMIKSGVGYLHRNYTREGQLKSIPRQVEQYEAVLNLESKMRELGYDTSNMRESIKKSGVVIAKELSTLLGGESVVIVNEQTFSVGSAVDRLIAEKSKTLLLEDGEDTRPLS